MPKRFRRFSLAVSSLVLWGCAEAKSTQDDHAQWSLAARPLLDIGDDETGSHESAGDVSGATRLIDGSVIVADRESSSLKVFSAGGKLLRSVGRAGQGPGEFARLNTMLRCGDSLYVFDGGTRKYNVFSLDGVLRRQFVLTGPAPGDFAYRTACNAQGVLINYGWDLLRDLPKQSGVTRTSVPYWLSKPDGTVLANLGRFSSSERWATVTATVSGTGPLPLGKQPVVAAGHSRVYVGLADSFAIDVFGLDGTRQRTIQRPSVVRRATSTDVERFKLLDTAGRSQRDNAATVKAWKAMQFAQTLPPYSALVVDVYDHLWVRVFPGADETTAAWIIFSPDGVAIAHIALPLALEVAEVGADYVLGTETQVHTGIKRVKVFRLTRTRTSSLP